MQLKEQYRAMVSRYEAAENQRKFMVECLLNDDSSYYTHENNLKIIQADLEYLLKLKEAHRREVHK